MATGFSCVRTGYSKLSLYKIMGGGCVLDFAKSKTTHSKPAMQVMWVQCPWPPYDMARNPTWRGTAFLDKKTAVWQDSNSAYFC